MSLFRVIYSEVSRSQSVVTQQSSMASSVLDAIKSYVPKVQSAWIGGDADEFAADVGRKLVPAMLELIAAIAGININLSKAIDVVNQADKQIQTLANGARDTFSKIFTQ